MAEPGHGAQVVRVTDSHTYELNEHELEQILLKEEIKDLPVVVVSVAGAYRGGKSFLLNFFLRYLKSSVAVLLMDTQGAFDSISTVRDCSTIFALSALLSSVQIYNLSQNILEDDLQQLQLFTEYGKMVKGQGGKAFQVLEFLVRDWQFPEDYPFGAYGGEHFIQRKLEIKPNLHKEMQELRQHIRSSFEKVSCFLMPHPGLKVLKPNFLGKISDIGADFRTHLIDLVSSLFGAEKLMPKTINGEQIKARELLIYFKTYVTLLNSDTIPSPMSIMKATVEAGLNFAFNEARHIYEIGMDADCGPKQPSIPAGDLKILHNKHFNTAIAVFTTKKKMGTAKEAENYLEKLKQELDQRLPQFGQSNLAKTQTAINNAKEAYEEAVRKITKGHPLCVHPLNIDNIHEAGLDVATKTFDKERKTITYNPDNERTQFIEGFKQQKALLQILNDQNNKVNVTLLGNEYWQRMQANSTLETPLTDEQFKQEHEKARRRALENLDSKRNIPCTYTEDVYKDTLIKTIDESFGQLNRLNESMNKVAVLKAVSKYDNYMRSALDTRIQCMHPNGLERENHNGLCRALVKLRPQKLCCDGFDTSDKIEKTLQEIISQRYTELKSLNNSANEVTVQKAFNVYVSTINDIFKPPPSWLLIVPVFIDLKKAAQNHKETKAKANEVFYNRRRDNSYQYSSDTFKNELDQKIEAYYSIALQKYQDKAKQYIEIAVKVAVNVIARVV